MSSRTREHASFATTASFAKLVGESSIPVLVSFQTPWSQAMAPVLDRLAEAFAGHLRIVQVNVSAHPELAARFKIRAVPTLLIFKSGIPVEFIVGTVPMRFIFETLCKTLGVRPKITNARGMEVLSQWPWKLRWVPDSTFAW